ncbi:hypothetical protein LINPERPRIM_LOCUS15756 [Linum perenne]
MSLMEMLPPPPPPLYHHHHLRRISIAGSDDLSCFSDADDVDSTYSQFYSTAGGSYYSSDGEVLDSRRASSASERSVAVEIEDEAAEVVKVNYLENNNKAEEKDCRICHLDLESNIHESGIPIELGCSCKNDLAAAHKQCAETWFKIKGNKTCEICNSIARNVVGVTEAETVVVLVEPSTTVAAVASSSQHSETNRSFWQGHRFLNFLLGCMVFAFVISWLFHFNVPSS